MPPANRSLLLEFAAQAATKSSCLNTLIIGHTGTSAEEGDQFLQALAEDKIDSLQVFRIINEKAWFADDRDGSIAPLLVLLARQTALKELTMQGNDLSDA